MFFFFLGDNTTQSTMRKPSPDPEFSSVKQVENYYKSIDGIHNDNSNSDNCLILFTLSFFLSVIFLGISGDKTLGEMMMSVYYVFGSVFLLGGVICFLKRGIDAAIIPLFAGFVSILVALIS